MLNTKKKKIKVTIADHVSINKLQEQVNELQNEIDTMDERTDVVDVVGTYKDLTEYDISTISNNDVIKVLKDETRENATTYYRLVDDAWIYIGQLDPYYNTTQIDRKIKEVTDDLDSLKGNVQDYYSDGSEYKLIYRGYRFVVSDGEENPSKIETKSNEEEVTIYSPLRGIIISNKNELLALQAFKDAALGAINTYGTEILKISNRLTIAESNAGGAFAQAKSAMEVASKAEGIANEAVAQVDYLEKKVDTLEKVNSGMTYDLVNYNASGYIADLSKGALAVNLNEIGGITEKSENLLVIENVTETTKNGITYSIKDGVIKLNGTCTENFNIKLTFRKEKYPTPCAVAFFNTNYVEKGFQWGIYNNTMGSYGEISYGVQVANRSFSYPENTIIYGFRIYLYKDCVINNLVLKPTLIKGTTAPTEFSQGYDGLRYQDLDNIIVQGKNLLVIDDIPNTVVNGNTYSVKDGIIHVSGTSSSTASTKIYIPISKIKLREGTWYCNCSNETTASIQIYLVEKPVQDSRYHIIQNGNKSSFTMDDSNIEFPYIYIYVPANTTIPNLKFDLMLTPSAYSEFKVGHQPQVLLADKITAIKNYLISLGEDENVLGYGIDKDNCNYIDFERKKAVIKCAKVTLSSNASLFKENTETGYKTYYFIVSGEFKQGNNTFITTKIDGGDYNGIIAATSIGAYMQYITTTYSYFYVCISDDISNYYNSDIVCVLFTPTEVDLSLILTDDDQYIPVEGGGSLTFENEHKADLPYDFDAYEKIAAGGQ